MMYCAKKYTLFFLGLAAGVAVFLGVSWTVQAQLSTSPTLLKTGMIERVIPQSGGKGQYITIVGKQMGNIPGDVTFVQGAQAVPADISFPAQCARTWWRDNAVIIKVPATAKQGENKIKVKNLNGDQIGETSFTVTQASPAPGICGMEPDNGPVGVATTVYGERFGSKQGKVTFGTAAAEVVEGGWSDGAIRLKTVPQFDGTSATVRVVTTDNTLSSPGIFTNGRCRANSCGEGSSCCGDGSCRLAGACQEARAACTYSWSFYTGRLGEFGAACTNDQECLSGACLDGKCALGAKKVGEQCSFDAQCAGRLCANGLCAATKKIIGEKCENGDQCLSGSCLANTCVPGTKKFGDACGNNDECSSAVCVAGKCGQPTQCLRIEKMEPQGANIRQNSVFSVIFNQLVDESSARNFIQLMPSVKGTYEFRIVGQGDTAKSQVLFQPSELLSRQRRYALDVGNDVRAAHSENTVGRCVNDGKKLCNSPGEICTAHGAVCTNGAICTGDNAVCVGTGTRCTGQGSTCAEGADCSQKNRVIEQKCFSTAEAPATKKSWRQNIGNTATQAAKRLVAFFTSLQPLSVNAIEIQPAVKPNLRVEGHAESRTATLTWSYAGTELFDGFEIWRNSTEHIYDTSKTATSYTDRNLDHGRAYVYKVRTYKIAPNAAPPGTQCKLNSECASNTCINKVCVGHDDGDTCTNGSECASNYCAEEGTCQQNPQSQRPSAPSNLVATGATASEVALSWNDTSSNETSFLLERSGNDTAYEAIKIFGPNTTSYIDSGLARFTRYWYRIAAVNVAGQSDYSNAIDARTGILTFCFKSRPSTQALQSAEAVSATQIKLSWSDASNNESAFIIERSLDNTNFSSIAAPAEGAASYIDAGLSASTQYWYRVKAHNCKGDSAASAVLSSTTFAYDTSGADGGGGSVPPGGSCTNNYECASNTCENGICKELPPDTQCTLNTQCASLKCENGICALTGTAPPRSSCSSPTECRSGTCINSVCGGTTPVGGACTSNNQCQSLSCINGICSLLSNGSVCTISSQCSSGNCQDRRCVGSGGAVDTDSDGLPDAIEDKNINGVVDPGETDPKNPDTDGEGLTDGQEDNNKNGQQEPNETDPLNPDTDGDGLSDLVDPYPLDPTKPGSAQKDTDGDGIPDNLDPNPNNPDTDGDGLLDGQEDKNKNGKVDAGETNPTDPDTDHDGLLDAQEDKNKNISVDSDETNPLNPDTDGDALLDGVDPYPLDPTKPGSGPNDSDGDGIADSIEDKNKNGTVDKGETNPHIADTDYDGLLDGQEDKNKNGTVDKGETNPLKADSDGNGIKDGDQCTVIKTARAPQSLWSFFDKFGIGVLSLFSAPALAEEQTEKRVTGEFSDEAGVTLESATSKLSTPVLDGVADITNMSKATINLTWTNTSVNVDRYDIFRKRASESAFVEIGAVSRTTKTYTDNTNLAWGMQYVYTVQSVRGSARSALSNEKNISTLSTPPTPPLPLGSLRILKSGGGEVSLDILSCTGVACKQTYTVKALDTGGNDITNATGISYRWTFTTASIEKPQASGHQQGVKSYDITPLANGNATLSVTATQGAVTTSLTLSLIVDVCDYPWSAESAALDALDLKLSYCRGNGSEDTALPNISNPIKIASREKNIDFDEEYIFSTISSDVIILRVKKVGGSLANPPTYSAAQWYRSQFGRLASVHNPVNGYSAVKDATGVYVNAYDNVGGTASTTGPTIYYFTTNSGASQSTRAILDQLLQKAVFSQSLSYDPTPAGVNSHGAQFRRDARRMIDIEQFMFALRRAPTLPKIDSGSFIRNQTISAWPSWQNELGRELGITMPTDPYPAKNTFCRTASSCVPACTGTGSNYEEMTCWNPVERKFGIDSATGKTAVQTAVDTNNVSAYSYHYIPPATFASRIKGVFCAKFERLFTSSNEYIWCRPEQRTQNNTSLSAAGASCTTAVDCRTGECSSGFCKEISSTISPNRPPVIRAITYNGANLDGAVIRKIWAPSQVVTFSIDAHDEDGEIVQTTSAVGSQELSGGLSPSVDIQTLPVGQNTFSALVRDNYPSYTSKPAVFTVLEREPNHSPTLTIAAPKSGTIIRNEANINLTITATVSDEDADDSIDRVMYSLGSLVGRLDHITGSTYSKTISLENLEEKSDYTLQVSAYDRRHPTTYGENGLREYIISPIGIRNNTKPTITLNTPRIPATINAGNHVTFSGTIQDNDGVKGYNVYEQTSTGGWRGLMGFRWSVPQSNQSFTASTANDSPTPPSIGTHTYKIIAKDIYDFSSEKIVTVRVENPPPVVTITSPTTGTIIRNSPSEPLTVSATVTDPNAGDSIRQVTLQFLEGGLWVMARQRSTDTYTFNTTGTIPTGTYTIRVRAYDSHNAEGSAQKSVTIRNNTPPEISIIAPVQTKIDQGDPKRNPFVEVEISATAQDPDGVRAMFLYEVDKSGAQNNVGSADSSELKKKFKLTARDYDYTYKFAALDGNNMRSESSLVKFKVVVNGGWATKWISSTMSASQTVEGYTDEGDYYSYVIPTSAYPDGSGGTCSSQCGGGSQVLLCNNPPPGYSGQQCLISGIETRAMEQSRPCNTQICDADSDGVDDNVADKCPGVAGASNNSGCPIPEFSDWGAMRGDLLEFKYEYTNESAGLGRMGNAQIGFYWKVENYDTSVPNPVRIIYHYKHPDNTIGSYQPVADQPAQISSDKRVYFPIAPQNVDRQVIIELQIKSAITGTWFGRRYFTVNNNVPIISYVNALRGFCGSVDRQKGEAFTGDRDRCDGNAGVAIGMNGERTTDPNVLTISVEGMTYKEFDRISDTYYYQGSQLDPGWRKITAQYPGYNPKATAVFFTDRSDFYSPITQINSHDDMILDTCPNTDYNNQYACDNWGNNRTSCYDLNYVGQSCGGEVECASLYLRREVQCYNHRGVRNSPPAGYGL